ncbi:ABC transporter permease [Halarsenatibacter silvermanii]|uniref:Transport permease protein n=1 Tax=Halarsenatibacter silvermanii TaxID=321763 RepID=A0A1G9TUC3_9FIRM|nr:ABC transporter permease [Halarsenatibacter silvermanii]SDM51329.1 ABC-2 type transport system permease protein [Halarsenatibacter silvermanii]
MRISRFKLWLQQLAAISQKNIKIYYSESPVLIFGVLFPFCLFFAFALGRDLGFLELLPGLLGITFFFAGSAVGPFITPWETRTGTLERLLALPMPRWIMVIGDILAGFFFSLFLAIIIVLFSYIFLGVKVASIPLLILTSIIASLLFAGLGSAFAALPTDKPSNVMMLANSIRLPVIFISGIFVPLAELPFWGRVLSYISPVTYAVELLRAAYAGNNYLSPLISGAVLTGFMLIIVGGAVLFHRRTLTRRV